MTRRLPPRLRSLVDDTPPLMREFHRHAAVLLSIIDDHDDGTYEVGGYALIMGKVIDEYWHRVLTPVADGLARDLERMP